MTGRERVAVNACIIGEHSTGLGLYTIKLIRALDDLRDDLSELAPSLHWGSA